uniref:T9SS type A sorting domain-containing protein n=2 Tax=Roseivirga sp. TaxID=1964215 RepID=UPI004047D8CD
MRHVFSAILFLISINVFAQNADFAKLKRAYERLDSVDQSKLKSEYFLNKAFFFGQNLDRYRNLATTGADFFKTDKKEWYSMIQGLRKGKKGTPHFEDDLKQKLKLSNDQSLIPIGVLQIVGNWLNEKEVKANISGKKGSKKNINIDYEEIEILNASILLDKVYTGNLEFTFPKRTFHLEKKSKYKISANFADGQGFIDISEGGSYAVQYRSPGEKAIGIKFTSDEREITSYSILNVVTLEKETPDMIFEPKGKRKGLGSFASGYSMDVQTGAAPPEVLPGGFALLFNGCDQVFDRPVIFVEGFDTQQNDPEEKSTIYDFRRQVRRGLVEEFFTANGYDVIYLKFDDTHDDIRNNAEVLKDLIRDVNLRKTGSHPISVIGVSMGGLVARYALTDMERDGETHNVNRYISFDAPHLGANVSLGYQKLVNDVNDIAVRDILNISQQSIDVLLAAQNATSSKQMLLMYNGSAPNSAFINLQSEFNMLGWPSQGGIRNIAIINGSNNGTGQPNLNPSDKIMEVNWVALGVNAFVRVFSNALQSVDRVSKLEFFVGPVPTILKYGDYNFGAFNYDEIPGGWETNEPSNANLSIGWHPKTWVGVLNIVEWFGSTVNTFDRNELAFVPTFSAIASTSPRVTQADLFRTVANSASPFDAIYSRTANTNHIDFNGVFDIWVELLQNEYSLTLTTICQQSIGQMPRPATPRIDTDFYYLCEEQRRDFWVQSPSDIANLFDYKWTVYGPGATDFIEGETMTMRYPSPGIYTLELESHFNNDRIRIDGDPNNPIDFTQGLVNGPPSFANTRYVTVYASTSSQCSSSGGGGRGGGPIPEKSDISFEDNFEDTDKTNTTAVYPNPMEDKIYVNFSMKSEGEVNIKIIEAASGRTLSLFKETKTKGTYTQNFDTSGLKKGLHLLMIETSEYRRVHKLIK